MLKRGFVSGQHGNAVSGIVGSDLFSVYFFAVCSIRCKRVVLLSSYTCQVQIYSMLQNLRQIILFEIICYQYSFLNPSIFLILSLSFGFLFG